MRLDFLHIHSSTKTYHNRLKEKNRRYDNPAVYLIRHLKDLQKCKTIITLSLIFLVWKIVFFNIKCYLC